MCRSARGPRFVPFAAANNLHRLVVGVPQTVLLQPRNENGFRELVHMSWSNASVDVGIFFLLVGTSVRNRGAHRSQTQSHSWHQAFIYFALVDGAVAAGRTGANMRGSFQADAATMYDNGGGTQSSSGYMCSSGDSAFQNCVKRG